MKVKVQRFAAGVEVVIYEYEDSKERNEHVAEMVKHGWTPEYDWLMVKFTRM